MTDRKKKRAPQVAVNLSPASPAKGRRNNRIFGDLYKSLLFTCIILGLKFWVEHTTFGEALQAMTYSLLQLQLNSPETAKDMPIALIDISRLEPMAFTTGGWNRSATPRKPLFKILEAVAYHQPKAIAIDLDFSPDLRGYMTPEDRDFFRDCLRLRDRTGIPVFLGAHRTLHLRPEVWLGDKEFKDLPVNITVPGEEKRDKRKMPVWTKRDQDQDHGLTMGFALAEGYQHTDERLPRLLDWAINHVTQRYFGEQSITFGEILVDFSPRNLVPLRTIVPEVIIDQGSYLKGKTVLIGKAKLGTTPDVFDIPVEMPYQSSNVPGVELHLCAAYSVLHPLYGFTWAGRLTIDLLLSLGIIATLTLIRFHYRNETAREVNARRLQALLTTIVLVMLLALGGLFVRLTRVMWADYLLIFIALAIHPTFERFSVLCWSFIKGIVKSFRDNAIFDSSTEQRR